jgi:hypothetical protein
MNRLGPTLFLRDWLYFAGGSLPQIASVFTLFGLGAAITAGSIKGYDQYPAIKKAMDIIDRNRDRAPDPSKLRTELAGICRYLHSVDIDFGRDGAVEVSDKKITVPKSILRHDIKYVIKVLLLAALRQLMNGISGEEVIKKRDDIAAAMLSEEELAEEDALRILNDKPAVRIAPSETRGPVLDRDLIGQLIIYSEENNGHMENSWNLYVNRLRYALESDKPGKLAEFLAKLINAYAACKGGDNPTEADTKAAVKNLARALFGYANAQKADPASINRKKEAIYGAAWEIREEMIYAKIREFKPKKLFTDSLDEVGLRLKPAVPGKTAGQNLKKMLILLIVSAIPSMMGADWLGHDGSGLSMLPWIIYAGIGALAMVRIWKTDNANKKGFVIGLPEDISDIQEIAIRQAIGNRAKIIKTKDAGTFATLLRDKGLRIKGVFVDSSALQNKITPEDIIAVMLATTYDCIISMSDIDGRTRFAIAALIKELLPEIENMGGAEIFASVQEKLKTDPDFGRKIDTLRDLVKKHTEALSASTLYNDRSIIRTSLPVTMNASVVITEENALNNPTFAKGIEDVLNANSNVTFLYGRDMNEEQSGRFIRELGLKPEHAGKINRLTKIRPDGTMKNLGEIEDEIGSNMPAGFSLDNSAIAIAPGELREMGGKTARMKVLELKEIDMNGRKVLLSMNTERVAYRIALRDKSPEVSMSLDKELPGLFYDSKTKRYTYLPPVIPLNISEEAETFRHAMLLLSSAA